MCICALYEQGVIRVLESLSRVVQIISRVTVVVHASVSQVLNRVVSYESCHYYGCNTKAISSYYSTKTISTVGIV